MAGTDNKTTTLKAATLFTIALCVAVGVITRAGSDLFQGLLFFPFCFPILNNPSIFLTVSFFSRSVTVHLFQRLLRASRLLSFPASESLFHSPQTLPYFSIFLSSVVLSVAGECERSSPNNGHLFIFFLLVCDRFAMDTICKGVGWRVLWNGQKGGF